MKTRPKKLRYSIWMYFMLFAVVIIGSLWLFQMLFLDSYYQRVKIGEMCDHGEFLSSKDVNGDEFKAEKNRCAEAGISVFIVKNQIIIDTGIPADYEYLINVALDSLVNNDASAYCKLTRNESNDENYFVYAAASSVNGSTNVVLISSHSAINEISKVINWLFISVAILITIIGFLIAWYLSGKLTKPISDMSLTTKEWANGNDNVSFDTTSGYLEITELADALNHAKSEISKSGTLQRDLLANVSHDLKTPLTMIRAYAEMIDDISGNVKEKREKHTRVIVDEADRLARLVNDILNLSKLQSSVDSLNTQEINLSELTERVINRFSDYVQKQGFKIEDNIAPDLLTIVDEEKIEQVIYNLLSNSLNYTGDDKTVKVYLTAENDKILLEIIDSGKGIPEETLATIWERYYRFSETNTRPVKGTGLGLSIVKAILDSHGLKFGVRSKIGCGSNFYVEFDRLKNE